MRPLRVLAIVAATGLLVTSCGGDNGDDATEPTVADDGVSPDTQPDDENRAEGGCAIVSADEVEDATGESVVSTTELPTGCQWQISADDPLLSYEWQQVPGDGEEPFDANADLGPGYETEDIDGLGNRAYLRLQLDANGSPTAGETWVLVGDTAFFVRTAGLPAGDAEIAAQRDLAALIVDRLE